MAYLNRALTNFRNAVNAAYPGRDKTSDGWIGDTAHQSTSSDHNPDPAGQPDAGSVDAWDMDVDLRSDDDRAAIEALKRVFQAHPSSRYWIHNRIEASRSNGWRRVRYDGSNPHDKHVHWNTRESHEASTAPWVIEGDDMDSDQVTAAVWNVGAKEYVDQDGNKVRDTRKTLDILYSTHAAAVTSVAQVAALTEVVRQFGEIIRTGGGNADTAAILAGVDQRVARLETDIRDAVADLGEGGAAQVRAGSE